MTHLPKILLSWKFLENNNHRPLLWYVLASFMATLLLIYAVITANYRFAAIILLFAFIYFISSLYPALTVDCEINEEGIKIGRKFYKFYEIKKFWIIYEPSENINTLYLDFKNTIKPTLGLPLNDLDPVQVRSILLDYLKEDLNQNEEPLTDTISRLFRL